MEDQHKTKKQLIEELNQLRLEIARREAASAVPQGSERAIEEDLAKCHEIIDRASEAIFIMQDGWIKFANRACSERSGFSIGETMASNAIEAFIHADHREMVTQYHQRRLKGDDSHFRYEFKLLCKDGTIKWEELNSSLIMWDGKPAALCFLTDITERKQAEDTIAQTNEYWERTFNAVPDLIAIMDNEYKIVRTNKAMADRLGIAPEECLGQLCYKLVHGSDQPPVFCPHTVSLHDFGEHFVEVCEKRLNGDFIVSVSPIFDKEEKLIGCVHIARDITEHKREAEEKERLIGELQRALAEVRKLSGFIPICASCKKIRNDKGFWQQVEEYVSDNSDAQFTHSICPDCAHKLYPELYEDQPKHK